MDIIRDGIANLREWMREHLNFFSKLILFLSPYITTIVAVLSYRRRGYLAFGGEYLLPVFFWVIAWFLRQAASKYNYGIDIPVPLKRFTEVDQYGVVSAEHSRLQEMLLYMADLEDWLERENLSKKS